MSVYTYAIETETDGIKYLVGLSVKAETIVKANMEVMVLCVNSKRALKNPHLVSIKQL